jgi:hypothetical protein
MNILNLVKAILLRIKGDNLGKGKGQYRLTFRLFFVKLFTSRSDFNISCVMAGFPRSGTHWICNVIEKSSGRYCPNLEDIDFNRVYTDGRLCVIKIHARSKLVLKLRMFLSLPPHYFKKKYIYVYRDPRDAIISLYNMYNIIKKKNLSQKEFLHVYDPVGQYKWEINSWVLCKKKENVLIIRFEDLKLDSINTFKDIFTFLNLKSQLKEETLNEYVGVVENNERKKGTVSGWKTSYEDYKELIEEINKKLQHELILLNYND